ncbi:MAG: amidohydrolase family protein, partial [Alphaproteobacteria bacterium]
MSHTGADRATKAVATKRDAAMAHDLLIKNGIVIDGTGAPRRQADIAVKNGKIAEIGKIGDGAAKVIDASGAVVAPGFIDPHTHYDAQICWDPAISPSSWHGVTSVVMGNCGVGIAPCRPEAREIAMRDLVNVEGIPFEVLDRGITWDWRTFPEFLDAAEARGSALNLAFLAPLTPFRHWVMGEASMERGATPEETATIAALLREAVGHGAFGFSTTVLNQHMGYQARPLACRNASRDELKAYANTLKDAGKGAIEIALTQKISVLSDEEEDLLGFLSRESGRPVTFLALFQRDDIPDACPETRRRAKAYPGAVPQTSPLALTREINMRNPFSFAAYKSWGRVFADKSENAQRAVYADPAFRNAFREEMKNATGFSGDWRRVTVHEVHKPELKQYEGRTIADVAQARGADSRGKDPLDTFLDLALEDGLDIGYVLAQFNIDEKLVADNLTDPGVLIALGDGGAHVDMLCDAGYPTYLLGTWVRERQIMTLEQAIQRRTAQPAELGGIRGRG